MARETSNKLSTVALRARELDAALVAYQQALVAARQDPSVSYSELAEALRTSESGARWRCLAAQVGGEIHLRLFPVEDNGDDQL